MLAMPNSMDMDRGWKLGISEPPLQHGSSIILFTFSVLKDFTISLNLRGALIRNSEESSKSKNRRCQKERDSAALSLCHSHLGHSQLAATELGSKAVRLYIKWCWCTMLRCSKDNPIVLDEFFKVMTTYSTLPPTRLPAPVLSSNQLPVAGQPFERQGL